MEFNHRRKGVHQYSMAGVPPIGDISPTHLSPREKFAKEPFRMSFSNHNNNNNEMLCLNKLRPLPPISNIPGLNPDSEVIAAAEKKVFRTFKVQETDSPYVKLAKQGGRKNLLEYKEFANGLSRNKENHLAAPKRSELPLEVGFKHPEDKKERKQKAALKEENNNKKISNLNRKTDDSNNNNWNSDMINNNNNNNKSISKRKAFALLQKKGGVKERPDILPVDQAEILKHLNAPRRPALPKIKHYPRLAARFVKVGGR